MRAMGDRSTETGRQGAALGAARREVEPTRLDETEEGENEMAQDKDWR